MKFWSRQTASVADKMAALPDRLSDPIRLLVFCGPLLLAAIAIAALADWRSALLLALVLGALALLGVRQLARHAPAGSARGENDQQQQLDAAINNMRQGLLMFDAMGRLVLYNQRYLQMYRLSPEAVKPGLTLGD